MKDDHAARTDLSLIARMGDSRFRSQAWADFLERYTRVFYAWFRHWGIEPAIMEDVLQETTIRILGEIRIYEHRRDGSFRAWLKTLARSAWQQLIREAERAGARRKADFWVAVKTCRLDSDTAENHLMALFDQMANRELVDLAHSQVRSRVESETWESYRLVELEQKAVPEVLAAQQITPGTLYSRIYRVRRLLKKELEILDEPAH